MTRHANPPRDHALDCECATCRAALADRRRYSRGPIPAAEIREASAAGASDAELAVRYGRDRTVISRLVRGETHARAGGPVRVTGRPVRGEVATVSLELPAELRDQIDATRGPESRSAWLRRAAEERLERANPGVDPRA